MGSEGFICRQGQTSVLLEGNAEGEEENGVRIPWIHTCRLKREDQWQNVMYELACQDLR